MGEKVRNLFLLLICLAPLLAQTALKPVSVRLQWIDQFQFAGYYIAKEKGFYKEAGLDVTLQKFDQNKLAVDEVLSGRSTFGIGRSSLLIERMQGRPVVALAAILQNSPFILLSKKSRNIRVPKDLPGKKVMMTPDFQDTIAIRAMLDSQNVSMDDIEFIEHSYNINDLTNGKTDVMACYISNEPYTLKEKGIETNAISPEQYGFDFYSDILFTSENMIRTHPKTVRAFVDATLKGWEYAFSHIDETARLIHTNYNAQHKSLQSLIYEGEVLKTLAYRGNTPLGAMDIAKFRRISDIYKVLGIPQNEARLAGILYEDNSRQFLPLTIEERSFIHSQTIRYIASLSWPPFDFPSSDQSPKPQGIAMEFWKLIITKSKLNARYIPSPTWNASLNAIKTKTADITFAPSLSKVQSPYAIFSKPYATFPNVIVTRKNIDFIPGLESLEGKKVAVGEGYEIASKIAKDFPKITLVETEDTEQGLEMLSNGKVDAVVDILPVVAYLINSRHAFDLQIAGTTTYDYEAKMMIRNDYPELKSIIDKSIDSITPAERSRIFNRYIAVTYQQQRDYQWAYITAAVALLAILFFVYRQYELGRYNRQLLRIARTDHLTGLANRIQTDEKLVECYQLFRRERRIFSVILIDVDHFKKINDTFGHLIGDRILIEIGDLFTSHKREIDIVGRWGGEEFLIICPETTLAGAEHLANKLLYIVSKHTFSGSSNITCSFGVSEIRRSDRIEDLIGRADKALYRAKSEGRNCVRTR